MYYHDPDGNGVEIQVDNYADIADCKAFIRSPEFAANPLGVEFDPDVLAQRFRAGVPERKLLERATLAEALA